MQAGLVPIHGARGTAWSFVLAWTVAFAAGSGLAGAAEAMPPLDDLIEQAAGPEGGVVLAIERLRPLRSGGGSRYSVIVARDGRQSQSVIELVGGTPRIEAARGETRVLSAPIADALRGDMLGLAEVVRRAEALAPGFRAVEAEYESERGRVLAEVELTRGGTVLELALDRVWGNVIGIELEDDEEDEEDEEDDDEGDDAEGPDGER